MFCLATCSRVCFAWQHVGGDPLQHVVANAGVTRRQLWGRWTFRANKEKLCEGGRAPCWRGGAAPTPSCPPPSLVLPSILADLGLLILLVAPSKRYLVRAGAEFVQHQWKWAPEAYSETWHWVVVLLGSFEGLGSRHLELGSRSSKPSFRKVFRIFFSLGWDWLPWVWLKQCQSAWETKKEQMRKGWSWWENIESARKKLKRLRKSSNWPNISCSPPFRCSQGWSICKRWNKALF